MTNIEKNKAPTTIHHLAAAAAFLALALWIMAPVLGDFSRAALGHPGNDAWNHLWGFWFVADSLLSGELPVHTDLMAWPEGGSLWFIDTFGAVLTLPVQLIAGPVAAYNASYLFNFFLCGLGAYALSLRVTGSWYGALLAGLAYESTPQLLGQAYNGISETLAAGWLPLSLLAFRHAARTCRPRDVALAGAVFGITCLANWYYGLFALIAFAGFLARAAWRRWRRGRAWEGAAWGAGLRQAAVALSLGGAVAFLVAAPAFALFVRSMGAPDAIVTRDPRFVWSTLILHNMTDALALVKPGRFYSPDLKAAFNEDLIVVLYIGHFLLWPALLALAVARRRALSWAGLAAVYGVLTLGPFLYVAGNYLMVAGGWIPLPFLALFRWFPMFSRISHAYRFAVGITLALCVLLAWTVSYLQARRIPGWFLVLGLGAGRIVESFYGSSAVFPIPTSVVDIPAGYQVLRDAEGEGAVLDLPVGIPVLARSVYARNQLLHQRPSAYGLNDSMPDPLWENRFTRYCVELEWSDSSTLPSVLPWLDILTGREAAMEAGLRWVVLHPHLYHPPQYARMVRFLELVATPVHASDELRIYELTR